MSVFIDNVASRAGNLLQHGIAAIGLHLRHRPGVARADLGAARVTRPVARGPAMDPEILKQLEEAARTVGKLEWSRRYAEIVSGQAHARCGWAR